VKTRQDKKILVYGYGNPGRRDDGLGAALVARLEALQRTDIYTETNYQLNIEDGALLAEYDYAVFVDAGHETPEPYALEELFPAAEIRFSTHSVSAAAVLAICEEHFKTRPRTFLLAIRGYEFDFQEGLSPRACDNLEQAVEAILGLIHAWKEEQL
jgi:hydrogenase maturation protease